MDVSDLKGLQYLSLVLDLEDEFDCHVDVVSKGSSNKKFLNAIKMMRCFYMKEFNVSKSTAARDLNELANKNLINKESNKELIKYYKN